MQAKTSTSQEPEAEPLTSACPGCGEPGKPVRPATLRALLKPESAAGVADADYRFCAGQGCDVVYYDMGGTFTKGQLTVPVGVKEASGDRPLCYCYGHSVATIKAELRTKGRSDALDDIRRRMAGCGCACERTNPSGACCLGAVARGVEVARAELNDSASTPGRHRFGAETLAKVGTVLSAVAATSCCWLPLLLLACGVSGAGIAGALEAYRPAFLVVTAAFLGAAFYFAYRQPRPAAGGHDCCAVPPAGTGRSRAQTLNRATLWAVTLLAVVALFFPKALAALVGGGSGVTAPAVDGPPARVTTFAVTEMNCEGCSALVARALRKLPGVRGVDVDYPAGRVVVASDADAPDPTDAVLQALEKAGFPGEAVRNP